MNELDEYHQTLLKGFIANRWIIFLEIYVRSKMSVILHVQSVLFDPSVPEE